MSSSSTTSETLTLIPGLPNDLASIILTRIPFPHHARLKFTCKSWRFFLSPKNLLPLRRSILSPTFLTHLLCIFPQDPSLGPPYLFDPTTLSWAPLPPMPCSPHRYGLSNFASVAIGHRLFVLGGSYFDNRSFPSDRPRASSCVYSLDLSASKWSRLSPMLVPRGSFACAADLENSMIWVAGGGSRHILFPAGGTRIRAVERYDVGRDEWVEEGELPGIRAGCVGFMVNGKEFWVMGGYGVCQTVRGMFPVDEYYKDVVVLGLKSGEWRESGDMWEDGERWRLGNVVSVDGLDGVGHGMFMLDGDHIFRFDISSNRWCKESSPPRKAPADSSCGLVALGGELFVIFALPSRFNSPDLRKAKQKLLIQIYNPMKRNWRFTEARAPFKHQLDFKTAVMCTIRL